MPGHDTRDFEFAEAFDLGVKRVVQSPTEEQPKLPYTGALVALKSICNGCRWEADLVNSCDTRPEPAHSPNTRFVVCVHVNGATSTFDVANKRA